MIRSNIRTLLPALALGGLAAAPLAAQEGERDGFLSGFFRDGTTAFFLGGIAVVALAVVLLPEDDDDAPVSA